MIGAVDVLWVNILLKRVLMRMDEREEEELLLKNTFYC